MNPILEWKTMEYHHEPKSSDWFWALGIITITLIVIALMFNNIIFAIFILVSGLALAIHAWAKPELMNYSVTEKGVAIGTNMHLYESITAFYIEDLKHIEHIHPAIKSKILLKTNKSLFPLISIPISEKIDIKNLQSVLSKYIVEEKITETLSHKIMERFGF
ncbi:MAG: hypothetical protein Q7R78_01335 [bacterium]|nr:hypothetical protein [bacterium]